MKNKQLINDVFKEVLI